MVKLKYHRNPHSSTEVWGIEDELRNLPPNSEESRNRVVAIYAGQITDGFNATHIVDWILNIEARNDQLLQQGVAELLIAIEQLAHLDEASNRNDTAKAVIAWYIAAKTESDKQNIDATSALGFRVGDRVGVYLNVSDEGTGVITNINFSSRVATVDIDSASPGYHHRGEVYIPISPGLMWHIT